MVRTRFNQSRVGHGMRRGRTSPPSMKPRLWTRRARAPSTAIGNAGLVRAHELEDPDGIVPASRANAGRGPREDIALQAQLLRSHDCSRASSSRSAAANPGPFSSRRPS